MDDDVIFVGDTPEKPAKGPLVSPPNASLRPPFTKGLSNGVKKSIFSSSRKSTLDRFLESEKVLLQKKLEEQRRLEEFRQKQKDESEAREKELLSAFGTEFLTDHRHTVVDPREAERAKLKEGDVIRGRDKRALMHGDECPCCEKYFDALGLSEEERRKRVDQVSRHRYVGVPRARTPPNYWDVDFPTDEQLIARGAIRIAKELPKSRNGQCDKKESEEMNDENEEKNEENREVKEEGREEEDTVHMKGDTVVKKEREEEDGTVVKKEATVDVKIEDTVGETDGSAVVDMVEGEENGKEEKRKEGENTRRKKQIESDEWLECKRVR